MRYLLFFLFSFLFITGVKCQYKDSVMLTNYPVRNGMAYQYDYTNYGACNIGADTWVFVKSKSDSVFHPVNAVITGVFNLGENEIAVVLRQAGDINIIYSNLKFVAIKKGDLIRKGDLVGLMPYSTDEKGYSMDILMYENKKTLYANKILLHLKQIAQTECLLSATDGL